MPRYGNGNKIEPYGHMNSEEEEASTFDTMKNEKTND